MSYATVSDIESRLMRELTAAETTACALLLDDAAVIIDSYNANAPADAKKVVSCRIVMRAMPGSDAGIPLGATQGSQSALGYSNSWTISSGGAAGEMYLSRLDKKLLVTGDRIGSYSPVEALARRCPE